MKLVIVTTGTRGDVAPYVGLGMGLRAAGYDVALAAQEPFAAMVREGGLEFRRIPGDLRADLASTDGRRWQEGGLGPRTIPAIIRFVRKMVGDLSEGIIPAAQGADVLLLHRVAFEHGYLVAQAMGIPSLGMELFPSGFAPTEEFLPAGFGDRSLGRWGNRLVARYFRLRARNVDRLYGLAAFRRRLGLPAARAGAYWREMEAERWPIAHGFGSTIVPRPADWRPGLEVVGYWWPPRPCGWEPPAELVEFLASGPPPVFVGFGSIAPATGERLSEVAAAALRLAGVRGVIQAGWAGLTASGDDLLAIGDVPHDWLFPRMAALVHHAGAGTTAAGLRAGVPMVPVPVLADQPFWASRLAKLGVSPGSVPSKRLAAERLADLIRQAVAEPTYRERAAAVSARVRAEDGVRGVVEMLAGLDPPSRVA